jgi:hypothetical protein
MDITPHAVMKLSHILSVILLCPLWGNPVSALADPSEPVLTELTPTEADAIVSQQMAAKEQQRQARVDELESATVVESFEADLGERKVIFNRVLPSDLSAQTIRHSQKAEAATTPVLTEAEMEAWRAQQAAKRDETLFLSATVFEDGVTELNWTDEGVNYQAYANVDFHYLEGMAEFETVDARFSVIMAVGKDGTGSSTSLSKNFSQADVPTRWHPSLTDFSGQGVEYLVVAESNTVLDNATAFAGIEAMLLYYQEHEAELKVARQRREALREARARYLEANPPQPQDTIINFSPSPDSKSLQNR